MRGRVYVTMLHEELEAQPDAAVLAASQLLGAQPFRHVGKDGLASAERRNEATGALGTGRNK